MIFAVSLDTSLHGSHKAYISMINQHHLNHLVMENARQFFLHVIIFQLISVPCINQVVRLRQDLVLVQTRELGEVQRVYEEETRKFFSVWERRIVVRLRDSCFRLFSLYLFYALMRCNRSMNQGLQRH